MEPQPTSDPPEDQLPHLTPSQCAASPHPVEVLLSNSTPWPINRHHTLTVNANLHAIPQDSTTSTVVIGSSMVRDVQIPPFAGPCMVHCNPGARVLHLHKKLPSILSRYAKLENIILHTMETAAPTADPKNKLRMPTPTAFEKTQTKANPTDPKREDGTPTAAAPEKTVQPPAPLSGRVHTSAASEKTAQPSICVTDGSAQPPVCVNRDDSSTHPPSPLSEDSEGSSVFGSFNLSLPPLWPSP
ncbi:hypothetical protein SKAU_G00093120 [Synaphobranchus kaupii]|uniref:Uncharacterized protein n=1 Tax=Synaphobranchus kaupii TaxID=118154 RepID=A0A9Q1FXN0_SYNKA|nr:hypothetical protein SKAU_G00093120 [Synaphobranchus kaupii]